MKFSLATLGLFLIGLTGCTHIPMEAGIDAKYLSGKSLDDSEEVLEKQLRRSVVSGGDDYEIWALPYTAALVEAQTRSYAFKRGQSKETADKNVRLNIKALVEMGTCVEIHVSSTISENTNLRYYGLSLVDSTARPHPLTFVDFKKSTSQTSVYSMPMGKTTYVGSSTKHFNNGTACTARKVSLENGFGVTVQPRMKPGLKSYTMRWNVKNKPADEVVAKP